MTSPISDNLAKLRKQFADQLPGKLEKLRTQFQLLDPSNWMPAEAEVLRRLLHSLTGSAGTFGMMSVSNVSRDLENQLTTLLTSRAAPAAKDWRAFSADLNRLDKLARINLESNAPSLKAPAAPLRGVDRSPLIHLVEDDPAQAEHLSQALQEDNYRVQIFSSTKKFRDAFTSAGAECPAAVIMDMIFSDSDSTQGHLFALPAGYLCIGTRRPSRSSCRLSRRCLPLHGQTCRPRVVACPARRAYRSPARAALQDPDG